MDASARQALVLLERHTKEANFKQTLGDRFESSKLLRLQIEDLQKKLKEKENKLTEAHKTIRALTEEIRLLHKKLNFEKRKHQEQRLFRSQPTQTSSRCASQVFVNQPGVSQFNPTLAPVSKSLLKHPTVKILKVRLVDCRHKLQPNGVLKLLQKENDEVHHEDRNSDQENESVFSCMEDSSLFETQLQEEQLKEHYSCGRCSRTFSQSVLLNLHIKMGHISHSSSSSSRYSGGSCRQIYGQGPSHGKTLSQLNHLKLHQRINLKRQRKSVKKKQKSPKQTAFPCNQCSKVFPQSNYLFLHQRTHKKKAAKLADCIKDCRVCIRKMADPCDELSKTFSEADDHGLYKNMSEMHTGSSDCVSDTWKPVMEVTYPCGQCGKAFSKLNHLKLHQRVHGAISPPRRFCSSAKQAEDAFKEASENTPPLCGKCGKVFSSWAHLQIHQMQHARDKLFPCPACHKTFATSSYLQAHQRNAHEAKTYMCSECGRGPMIPSHLSLERPTVCAGCTEAQNLQSLLESTATTNQERNHWNRDERPFPCTSCDRTFGHLGELQQHLRWHARWSMS